jgi:hypothetical protein
VAQHRRGQHPQIIPVARHPANAWMMLGADPPMCKRYCAKSPHTVFMH